MHIYEQDGHYYPSVTTIIHSLGSDDLMKWSNAMGFARKKYEKIMNDSAAFGTLIHSHLQAIVDPEHADVVPVSTPMEMYDVNKVLERFKAKLSLYSYSTIFTEKTMISPTLGYAGTMDWYAYINGYKLVNDFKTAKAPRHHMLLQLGGYYNLLTDMGETGIEGGNIINANLRGCMFTPISLSTLKLYADAFNHLAEFYFRYHPLEDAPLVSDFDLVV